MKRNRSLGNPSVALLVVSILILVVTPAMWAQAKYKTLYQFTDGHDGGQPSAGLTFDHNGNLYGTTCCGGDSSQGDGTVFELTRSDKGWTESVLYSFSGGKDGADPDASVIFDANGNLYGTTANGGNSNCSFGCGVVFQLTPNSGGGWTESVLHSFAGGGRDGAIPTAGLIFDSSGNLYGTTSRGGAHDEGTIFQLTHIGKAWKEKVLYDFVDGSVGGSASGLIFDAKGNLYGTRQFGGTHNLGTVFKLARSKGSWTFSVLHNFHRKDGGQPLGTPFMDGANNLYGTTYLGGRYGYGTVFKLTHSKGGWNETVVHSFSDTDGATPYSGVILNSAGIIYGTATGGGNLNRCSGQGCGVVFKLTPNSNGGWKETKLKVFGDNPGAFPWASVILDSAGNLFGATNGDASATFGTVFEITP
jgi:uncharacterized repeat protein (TIGR03803 family)